LGHKVAALRSLMSKDRHFEDVVSVEIGGPLPGEAGQGGVSTWLAKCDAAGARIHRRGAAGNDKTRCHHSGCSGFCGN
jgi:hypothetical protein